jgi:hypothetical protein
MTMAHALLGPASAGFFVALLTVRAAAQEHHHPPRDAALHERFYSNWMRPDDPTKSCCNLIDCYPTETRFVSGYWMARRREDGKWLRVPDAKVEHHRDNPDGRAHLCAPPPDREDLHEGGVICFSAGAGT